MRDNGVGWELRSILQSVINFADFIHATHMRGNYRVIYVLMQCNSVPRAISVGCTHLMVTISVYRSVIFSLDWSNEKHHLPFFTTLRKFSISRSKHIGTTKSTATIVTSYRFATEHVTSSGLMLRSHLHKKTFQFDEDATS